MIKKKIFSLMCLMTVLILCVVGMSVVFASDEELTWDEILIKEEFSVGETVVIPNVSARVGETTVNAKFILQFPDGTNYSDIDEDFSTESKFILSQAGIYKLSYHAEINGVKSSISKEFTATENLFSVSGSESSIEFGKDTSIYNSEKEGLNLKLAAGDTFKYNEYIDFENSNGAINLITFYAVPSVDREADFSGVTLIITDAFDEENRVEVKIKAIEGEMTSAGWDWTYVSACAVKAGQVTTGYSPGNVFEVQVDSIFGAGAYFSFYGSSFNNKDSYPTERPISIEFDYQEKQLFVSSSCGRNLICDLDDEFFFSTKLWDGFTDGRAFISLKGNTYYKEAGNILITNICNEDLSGENTLTKQSEPQFVIEDNGFDLQALTTVVGYDFPVFNATAVDVYDGILPVVVKAYNGYYSTAKSELDIINGCVCPDKVGIITLEYTTKTFDGKEYKKLIDVLAVGEKTLSVDLKEGYKTQAKTGDLVDLAEFSFVGNTGETNNIIKVNFNGEDCPIVNNAFRAIYSGEYIVDIMVTDRIGQTDVKSYTVSVEENGNPVFIRDVVIPKYFIVGQDYLLPELEAYDYWDGEKQITTRLYVNNVEGNKVNISQAGDVIIKYVAETATGINEKIYYAKAIDTSAGSNIDLSKYFKLTGLSSTLDRKGMNFIATGSNSVAKAEFVNYLSAFDFSVEFVVNPEKRNFSSIYFKITDTINTEKSITFTVNMQTLTLYVNGNDTAMAIDSAALFDTDGVDFCKISFVGYNGILTFGKSQFVMNDLVDFTDGLVALEIGVEGINGESAFSLRRLCNQTIKSTIKADNIAPTVSYGGTYDIFSEKGSEITVFSAVASDVLSPLKDFYLSVICPNGEFAVATNGTVLNKVSPKESYKLILDSYGKYDVAYYAEDANGIIAPTVGQIITVVDKEPPVIKLSSGFPTEVKVGTTINIPKVTATDKIDGNVKVYVFITEPDTGMKKQFNGSSFIVEHIGVYTISFMSYDNSGNISYQTRYITVEK